MIKLFYIPETRNIVAKSNQIFYSLPNLEVIDKPVTYLPCRPFSVTKNSSQWKSIPKDVSIPSEIIQIHKVTLEVNKSNDSTFQLEGYLPLYVLNGLTNLLIQES